jgi:hypothetical protein
VQLTFYEQVHTLSAIASCYRDSITDFTLQLREFVTRVEKEMREGAPKPKKSPPLPRGLTRPQMRPPLPFPDTERT